jgi:1-deoxy-D-xylulose-5-phosphate synthase
VRQIASRHRAVITVEENAVQGGAGSAVAEALAEAGISIPMHLIGIPDRFIEHGSREDCLALAGLDAAGLAKHIDGWWQTQRNLSRTGT